jgi:hypothetical protein
MHPNSARPGATPDWRAPNWPSGPWRDRGALGTVALVHPIERLRYVARARGADAEALVVETASALRGLGLDPSGLVVACRRIVERHPTCGPLWWLCARLLTAPDPGRAIRATVEEIANDPTAGRLADAFGEGATVATVGWPVLAADALACRGDLRVLAVDADNLTSSFVQRLERLDVECELVPTHAAAIAAAAADVVLVEAEATAAERAVVPVGSTVLAATASLAGTPVWLVAGRGRRLPGPVIDVIVERSTPSRDPFAAAVEAITTSVVTHVAGPDGVTVMSLDALRAECELAPELLRHSPI